MEIDKKKLSTALIEAMDKEELHTSECGKLLNMKPCYVSMARSEKSWSAMGRAPWERIEEWFNTRAPLREFVIPKDEPIVPISISKIETKSPGEIKTLPETVHHFLKQKKVKKEKNGKSVKVILFQGELEKLQKRLQGLEEQNALLMNDNNQLSQEILTLQKNFADFTIAETTSNSLMRDMVAELKNKLKAFENNQSSMYKEFMDQARDLRDGISHLVTIPKETSTPHIILFQRNIYPKP